MSANLGRAACGLQRADQASRAGPAAAQRRHDGEGFGHQHRACKLEAVGQTPEALAVNTSGIVAIVSPEHKLALYFTGHQHAGMNLADILAQRARSPAAPIQMSDALACNFAGPLGTIVAKCPAHGRRKLVEVIELVGDNFPQPCRCIIEVLAKVYAADAYRPCTPAMHAGLPEGHAVRSGGISSRSPMAACQLSALNKSRNAG